MATNNLPSNPAQITKELVKASYNLEKTRLDYQKILQNAENITWTRENIEDDLLAQAKFVASKLTEKKDQDKRPLIDAGKIIQAEYNDLFNPINDVISRKAEAKKTLALQMQKEDDEIKAEQDRIANIKNHIAVFISGITNDISASTTDTQIVSIEKRIGSELSRKGFYMEFLDSFRTQCEELKPLIDTQKKYIRTLKTIEDNKNAAILSGNDSKAVDLRQQAEDLQEIIEENKIRLQQKAFEQVENSDIVVGESTVSVPNASRTTWKWRVDDLNLLFKKMPQLVELVPNKEKIDAILKEKKDSGALTGKREEKLFGITFYQDKSFK